ncbi:MAG TPA: M15 family metallopeptidase [Gemmatimonadaceae bacterium]|nr:M15 family metallopeptidase [Gemmatimonadaceae bacterium]
MSRHAHAPISRGARALGIGTLLVSQLAQLSCARGAVTSGSPAPGATSVRASAPAPAPPPARWLGLLGEYGDGAAWRVVAEHEGTLRLVDTALRVTPLTERGDADFVTDSGGVRVRFTRDAQGQATELQLGDVRLARNRIEPSAGTNQLRVTPVRSVDSLRAEALAASPPAEAGPFVPNDLVELVRLDPSIRLEVRYATTNNFLGTRFYDQPRAFLQRPAAEAVVRAHRALRASGYGLLIHDAYRPWYVTKMFWDAVPLDTRWLVADPAQGSRHNRGAAVDLTLFELATGHPVEMPSTYDESTGRAYAEYPGGTSRQRWHRALLRSAMVAEGFRVNLQEWWHFDHSTWRSYAITNVPFDRIAP